MQNWIDYLKSVDTPTLIDAIGNDFALDSFIRMVAE